MRTETLHRIEIAKIAVSLKENEGYCLKCKEKGVFEGEEEVTMKNGRPAKRGKCPGCGTGMYKILPSKK